MSETCTDNCAMKSPKVMDPFIPLKIVVEGIVDAVDGLRVGNLKTNLSLWFEWFGLITSSIIYMICRRKIPCRIIPLRRVPPSKLPVMVIFSP